jgi:hypothetical protein
MSSFRTNGYEAGDSHQKLMDLLSVETKERLIQARKRWLDQLISPFARELHDMPVKQGRPRRRPGD